VALSFYGVRHVTSEPVRSRVLSAHLSYGWVVGLLMVCLVVLVKEVLSKVVSEIPPNRMDTVGVVLRVVQLDEE